MYNILIWGSGREYNRYFNLIRLFEQNGEISVVGIIPYTNEQHKTIDGYPVYEETDLKNLNFDYCLVTLPNFDDIKRRAGAFGVAKDRLIKIRVLEVPYFSFTEYISLREEYVSILSINCWAGLCYHYLDLPFASPTINLWFTPSDFNKFAANMDHYLSLPVEFAGTGYSYALLQDYPVGRLGDILLHFNHYTSFEDAVSSWERRKRRINKSNIIVVSRAMSKDEVQNFARLPYEHKLVFVPAYLGAGDDICFPVNYNCCGGGDDFARYINEIAQGTLSMVDLISCLRHKRDFKRFS